MIALAVVIVIIVVIALLRIGVTVRYSEDGFLVIAHLGPFMIKLYPDRMDQIEDKTKKIKDLLVEEKKGGSIEQMKELMPAIRDTLQRLKRKLKINELTIYYMAAGTDPAKSAINFGIASAGLGFLVPILENNFKIKKRDFRTNVSFTEKDPYVYVHARLSLAVWEIIYIAWGIAVKVSRNSISKSNNRKVDKHNGQTSNKRSDGDNNAEDQGYGGR